MEPTLQAGQIVRIIKSKNYHPSRWDLVAITFKNDSDQTDSTIFRVLALGGETIRFAGDGIFIDGKIVPRPSIPISYKNLDYRNYVHGVDSTFSGPSDHIFVVGDNFEWARDSRYIGSIPLSQIIGKVES